MSNKLAKRNLENSNDIIIDDGSKVYNIKNKRGKVLGNFEFRPSDTNIVERYEKVSKNIDSMQFPEGKDDDLTYRKAEKFIIEQISYLVDADAKESFFSILGPFSPLASGELYFENVVDAVAKVINKELNVRVKKVQRRMNKYVAKYHN